MKKLFILILILAANFNTQNFAAQNTVDQDFVKTQKACRQLAILVAKQMTFDSKPTPFQLPTPDFDAEYENNMLESDEENEEE